jgi:MFS family permease
VATASRSAPVTAQPNRDGLKVGPFWLEPGISRLNVYTLLYASFFTIASSVFLSLSQPYVFEEILKIPQDVQGQLSGTLVLYNEIVVLLLISPLGVLSDKIGRRPIWAAGYFFLFIGYMLYPTAQSVEELTLYRMIFAVGAACNTAMIATVQVDYPQDPWRGRLIGICGLLQGLGVVLIGVGGSNLPRLYSFLGSDAISAGQLAFWTFATVCLINAVILRLGLKGGTPSGKREQDTPVLQKFRIGISQARNPRIFLAYLAAGVSRGDLIVVSTFFSLWLVQAGVANGLETEDALAQGGKFFGVVQLVALLWAPVSGIIIDKFNRVTALCIAMALAAAGYLSVGAVADPTSNIMYLAAIILGMGEVNAVLAAQGLVAQEAPKEHRGAIIGVFGFFGAAGILSAATYGGYLFDNWMPAGPFVLMGIANATLLVIALVIRVLAGTSSHVAYAPETAE